MKARPLQLGAVDGSDPLADNLNLIRARALTTEFPLSDEPRSSRTVRKQADADRRLYCR